MSTLYLQYSEYSAVKSELLKEKAEVNRLTQLMNQIIDDIQEKAPVFNQQKQDLDHALQEVGRLTAELTGCIGERDVAKSTVESLAKQCEGLALENKVFGQGEEKNADVFKRII